jgi:branched-chain amino acid transport system ATP-binding protein
MLAISRALLAQPRLLLLDEPTEGLAPTIADRIVGLMKELVAERIAVVMTAPQADLAAGLAHEILALRAGRIIARFTGAEIRADPAKLHTVLVPSSTSVKYQRGGQLDNRPLSADVPILDAHSQRGELRQ